MSLNLQEILAGAGIGCPRDASTFETPSRCGLYVDLQVLSQWTAAKTPVGGEVRVTVGFMALKFFDKNGDALKWLGSALQQFLENRQVPARTSIVDGVLVTESPWAERYQFRSAMIEFTEHESFRKVVWPSMAKDFERDERELNSLYQQSRSGIFSVLVAHIAKSERAWAFSHFNLTQRRGESGFRWTIDVGTDLHLIEVIERLWNRYVAHGMTSMVTLRSGASHPPVDVAPTWLSETIEFRASGFSPVAIREFSNYLKDFVNSIYLGTVDDFPVTAARNSEPASLASA